VLCRAFFLDLETHLDPQTSPTHPGFAAPRNEDDVWVERAFSRLDPLFQAVGWSDDEYSWVNATSQAGGVVFCSFASPNLSFWARLVCDATGRREARRLPHNDRGMKLNRSKFYVTFETNEGDTPRVLVSGISSSWARSSRGSLPIAWGIDPALAEIFPALFDYYVSTASSNDSFVAGPAGGGYVYLNQQTREQLRMYAMRVGQLLKKYGPNVVDTFGLAGLQTMEDYASFAAIGGAAPSAFVSQQTYPFIPLDGLICPENNMRLSDGTPVICTSHDPDLFYFDSFEGMLNSSCPACDLATRLKKVAEKQKPPCAAHTVHPHFYISGRLNAVPDDSGTSFWRMVA
jgi:hypothetical protein